MELNPQFAYFYLTIPFIIFWLLLFIWYKHTRKEQLSVSMWLLPLGTVSELLYVHDYWRPLSILYISIGPIPIRLEDIVFVFTISGIAAVGYKSIFHVQVHDLNTYIVQKRSIVLLFIISTVISLILFFVGINSIIATSIGFLSGALYILYLRKDLRYISFLSGIFVMILMFIGYTVLIHIVINTEYLLRNGWLLYGTPLGIRIFGIPVTEMIWGFSWGSCVGPLYSFIKGIT
jgi:hypothetical protein